MSKLPPRTPDTMVDAIALTSPSGKMSKRARKAAEKRLARSLFGNGLSLSSPVQPSERESLLQQAARLRDLASRGMNSRKYAREAERLERLADEMGKESVR